MVLDRISKNEYDVLEQSKGICYVGILGVLKIALLALFVGACMRRAVRNSLIMIFVAMVLMFSTCDDV